MGNDDDEIPWSEDADPPTEAEVAAMARREIAPSLIAMARLAANPRDPAAGREAELLIETTLVRIKAQIENPTTPEDVRRDLQDILKKIRQ